MALSASKKTALDSAFLKICGQISAKQSAFRSQTGRYWQGVQVNAESPDLSRHPTDQVEDWTGFTFTATQGSLQVDVYSGPRGDGYTVHLEVPVNQVVYMKTKDFGPEGRSYDWSVRTLF